MLTIPILSRLRFGDYQRIILAIGLLIFEKLLRISTSILPKQLLSIPRYILGCFLPNVFRDDLFNHSFCNINHHPTHAKTESTYDRRILDMKTTPELLAFHGFRSEDHLISTADGYYLVMHRIANTENDQDCDPFSTPKSNSSKSKLQQQHRPAIIMVHGAMLSSEVWVCHEKRKRNFALQLVLAGYDVWLYNRRGNRYSQKHIVHTSDQREFWDFSIDQCIAHDIPASIEHILQVTGCKQVGIVGFSQGTIESFAALALSPRLAKRVSCVVALSATTCPHHLPSSFFNSMVQWSPELIYLLLGKKSIIASTYFWQRIISPSTWVRMLDSSMSFLFNWTNQNIRTSDKINLYQHLYSQTSVKQIVHWLQVSRASRFQMYDDHPSSHIVVPEYPIDTISTPVAAFCGSKDNLVNIQALRHTLRNSGTVYEIENYEHMDPLWGHDAYQCIYPTALDFIQTWMPTDLNYHVDCNQQIQHQSLTASHTKPRSVAVNQNTFKSTAVASSSHTIKEAATTPAAISNRKFLQKEDTLR